MIGDKYPAAVATHTTEPSHAVQKQRAKAKKAKGVTTGIRRHTENSGAKLLNGEQVD